MKPTRSPASQTPDDEEGRIELRSIFETLWRRRLLLILGALGGLILSFAIVSQITPRYSARASLMLDPRSAQVLGSRDIVSDVNLNNPLLDTEAAVLRSNLLIEDVLTSIGRERLAPLDPALETPGALDRLRTLVKSLAGLTDSAPEAEDAALDEEARWLRRLTVALRQSLSVSREGQSYAISVSVETRDAELSALLANRIIEVYIQRQIDQRSAFAREATAFLETRVAELAAEVEAAEAAVEQFKIDQVAISGMSAETMSQQMLGLSTQLALSRADLATATARYEQVQAVTESDGIGAAAELLSSPFVLSLREQLSTLRREAADLATRLGPEHPDRQRLDNSIALVERDLTEEVDKIVSNLRNDMAVAESRVASLQASLGELENAFAEASRSSLDLRQLEREAEVVRTTYGDILSRLNETRSLEELQQSDARMLERASVPGAPSAPRITLFTAFGGVLGLTVGILAVFALELTGAGFNRSQETERATGLTVLTSTPRERWRSPQGMLRSIDRAPYQPYAERIRQLRAYLGQRRGGLAAPPQTVLITSALPGDGKSTTAIALAQIETMAKRSCVVLDLDVRRSGLGREFVYQPPGGGDLSSLLRGRCTLDQALFRPEGRSFDLLTTTLPDQRLLDETELQKVADLIAALRKRYQIVVIDSAPILPVPDAILLGQLVDATVFVLRQGDTPRRAVTEAIKRLAEADIRPYGLVMTKVDARQEADAYGMKGYGYAPR